MLDALMLTLVLQARFHSPGCVTGEGWEFVVRGGDVEKSPRWDESRDAPPLTPRAAERSARALLGRLSCKEPGQWELAAVTLRPVAGERDVWIYLVTLLEPMRPAKGSVAGSAIRRAVDVPVLMDGTALTPSVGPWPGPRLLAPGAVRHTIQHRVGGTQVCPRS